MKILVLATLTFLHTYPVLASEQLDVIEIETEQPQISEQQQLEDYQRQSNEQRRQLNRNTPESLDQTSTNKAQWEDVLDEIQDRWIRIEQDRKSRPPNLPNR